MNSFRRQLAGSHLGGEVALVVLLVSILSLMILPLPPVVIDTLLAVNIGLSVLLLMAALYASTATALSTFPSLLLFTTLFRLSLNIASTKAILLHADAGHIIDSFGNLVVGGNLIVGLVVFTIIAAVQFIVIAKGSERTSEVGARFALDAMPGQQMSIDAELRGGTLTPEEARRRRAQLAMESQLFGGLDGAMKFVKGDAIAALVITAINIIAGIAVGVLYHGMEAGDAAQRFSVLAVGDAMVSQIPSLLISTAAGVLTTRVTDKLSPQQTPLGQEIVSQLSRSPAAMWMASALLLGFAAVPGFPWPVFLGLAGAMAWSGYRTQARRTHPGSSSGARGRDAIPSMRAFGSKGDAPSIGRSAPQFAGGVSLKLSPAVAARLVPANLDSAISQERATLEADLGLPFPGIDAWVADSLSGETYEILLHDVPHGGGQLPAGRVLVGTDHTPLPADCVAAGEPINGYWVLAGDLAPGSSLGRTAEQVLASHVVGVISANARQFVGIQETQWLFERLNVQYQGLVGEVQKVLQVQKISEVLRRLLEERVPIRSMRNILEALIYWGPKEKDVLVLTEHVRIELGRFIAHRASGGSGEVRALTFHVDVEQVIRQSIKATPSGNYLALASDESEPLLAKIEAGASSHAPGVVLITSMDIRRYVKRLLEPTLGWLPVYSYQELSEHVAIVPVGMVEL